VNENPSAVKIRLFLVDDHEVVRRGLRMLLETQDDMEIIGESGSGATALQLLKSLQPDIILMDITLPDISGIELTRQLQQSGALAKIIALTIHEDEQFFFEMLQAGASGYVPKRAAPEDLLTAIRMVYRDEIYIYPMLTKHLVNDFLQRAAEEEATKETMDGLTAREYEILVALAGGESNEEIAVNFSISKHTVARHRENLMRKLELHSRSELVKYAIRKGIIEP
jgi:two-component system, NarL family, response regulator NreC